LELLKEADLDQAEEKAEWLGSVPFEEEYYLKELAF